MRGILVLLTIVGVFYGIYWSMNKYHEPDGVLGHQLMRKYIQYMEQAEAEGDTKEYQRLVDNSEVYLLRCWRTGESIGDQILGEPKGLAWEKHPDCKNITMRWFNNYRDNRTLIKQGHMPDGW